MEIFLKMMVAYIPVVTILVLLLGALGITSLVFKRLSKIKSDIIFFQRIVKSLLFLVSLLLIISYSPLSDETKGHIFSFLGILFTATIALSSTTFLGNMLAGFMLRAFRNFHMGDFIKVADLFGRVSERGIFHTEIQTEDRALVTIPNMYLISNPISVIRTSGTIIAAEVTLGYDVHRVSIEKALLQAAENTGLKEPFVHITELGNFSVGYRVAGFLEEVKHIVSIRSKLREQMLDQLHAYSIEIVSPHFMNQRLYQPDVAFIPKPPSREDIEETDRAEIEIEKIMFDKADQAETLEKLEYNVKIFQDKILQLNDEMKKIENPDQKNKLSERIARYTQSIQKLLEMIENKKKKN